MKINAKFVMPVMALTMIFFNSNAFGAPADGKKEEANGEIIFKIHDVVPEKNADGKVVYCNIGATFFNRAKTDVANLALSLNWTDDVIGDIIDIEDREEKEKKKDKFKGAKPRYSTSNFTSKSVSVFLKLPRIKVNQQITMKTKVDTDRCFILLNDMDVEVSNCGTLGTGTSDRSSCSNYFRYISPKMGEYYTEFKKISLDEQIDEEEKQIVQLQDDVKKLYDETLHALEMITHPLSDEERKGPKTEGEK